MNRLQRTLLTTALAGCAAASQAASVTVRFDDPLFHGVSAPAHDTVKISYPKKAGSGSESANVQAGRFEGTVLAYSGVEQSIFVDGLNDLFMYCYDVYDKIGAGWTVDYTINLGGESARTLDFLGAVNSVLNKDKPDFDQFAWLHPTSGLVAAAIQIGIWESKYDTVGWDIGAGTFKASQLKAGTNSALQEFFGAIGTSASLDGQYVMTLESGNAQDMITGDPPPPPPNETVPEPGTLALLGAAGVGLFATRRRRGPGTAAG